MEVSAVLLGTALIVVGISFVVVAVFRALGHSWGLGWYELWLLPGTGLALVLLGRWLVR